MSLYATSTLFSVIGKLVTKEGQINGSIYISDGTEISGKLMIGAN